MRGGVSKSRARRSHLTPSKASQGKLLDAVTSKSAGIAYRQRLVSGEQEDMLTRQVQSFHRATNTVFQWVETSRKARRPCSPVNGNWTQHRPAICCLRRERD
jgi:hypothetical protein